MHVAPETDLSGCEPDEVAVRDLDRDIRFERRFLVRLQASYAPSLLSDIAHVHAERSACDKSSSRQTRAAAP